MIPPSTLFPKDRLMYGPEPRERTPAQPGAWTAATIGGLSGGIVAAIIAVTLSA